jgi:hypothetical protein
MDRWLRRPRGNCSRNASGSPNSAPKILFRRGTQEYWSRLYPTNDERDPLKEQAVVGQFEILRTRSLVPLMKARDFGTTPPKLRCELTHYRASQEIRQPCTSSDAHDLLNLLQWLVSWCVRARFPSCSCDRIYQRPTGHHSFSASNRYPTPRTVSKCVGRDGSSSR